jgi:hypothetical protein
MNDITITVEKVKLLDVLKSNRTTHGIAYASAWEGYCKMARTELEEKLARIKQGRRIDPFLGHNPPDDHTRDYDDVIEMLEMDVRDTVDLTQAQFRCYVKDNWGWKQTWTASNTAYIEASGR